MKGRKRKPTALRLIQGNPGRRPLPAREPKPELLRDLEPPDYLNDEGKKQWRYLAPALIKVGVLTALDAHALALLCDAIARWIYATQKVQASGLFVKTPNGYPVQSPLVSIQKAAHDQMYRMLAEFGMSPSSRPRVSGTGQSAGELDEWDEL